MAMVQTKAYILKASVGKKMSASVTSFVRKRMKRTYAKASTTVIKTSARSRFFSVKNAKTKSITNTPSTAKNSIDGKICLCSTRRVIDKIDDKYATTTNELKNALGNTNAGFAS